MRPLSNNADRRVRTSQCGRNSRPSIAGGVTWWCCRYSDVGELEDGGGSGGDEAGREAADGAVAEKDFPMERPRIVGVDLAGGDRTLICPAAKGEPGNEAAMISSELKVRCCAVSQNRQRRPLVREGAPPLLPSYYPSGRRRGLQQAPALRPAGAIFGVAPAAYDLRSKASNSGAFRRL